MVTFLAETKKAIAAAVAAGVAAWASGSATGQSGSALWAYVIGAAVAAAVLVYFVPNQPVGPKGPGA